ncbi:MAG: hypothetical protein KGI70_02820 [Patescibacteria group bacterium]|nr:hypothetical protein [Patescibacteria group bacterium]
MKKTALLVALLIAPSFALAAADTQVLELSAKAQVEGTSVPLGVVVSTDNQNVILSPTKADGATPVTFTLYVTPKPKPPPPPPANQSAAPVESSDSIQKGIAGFSPQTENAVGPIFNTIDSARQAAANALDQQLATTRTRLGPDAGKVLGAEAENNAAKDPAGMFWYILQTLYFYLLTILRFIVSSSGAFYPLLAILFLFFIWRVFRRFRRSAY